MDDYIKDILKACSSRAFHEYNKYHEGNIFSITKVSRQEHFHSNFLAWLFDSRASHGLGVFPVKQLLATIASSRTLPENINARIDENCVLPFTLGAFDIIYSVTKTELTFSDEKGKRAIDILVEVYTAGGKILPIVIENKVNSREHTRQTEAYFNYAEKTYQGEKYDKPIYVFLLPGYNKAEPCMDAFFTIRYQNLVDSVIEPSLWICRDNNVRNYLEMYLMCLSFQSDNEKGESIMATSSTESKILKEFMDSNKNFLVALIEMAKRDPDQDDETKKGLSKLESALRNKDYSKYIYNGREYNKRRLVLGVIKDYAEQNSHKTFEDIQSTFNISRKKGGYDIVRRFDDIINTTMESRYFCKDDEIIHSGDGTALVVCGEWGDDISHFLELVEKLGIKIVKKAD